MMGGTISVIALLLLALIVSEAYSRLLGTFMYCASCALITRDEIHSCGSRCNEFSQTSVYRRYMELSPVDRLALHLYILLLKLRSLLESRIGSFEIEILRVVREEEHPSSVLIAERLGCSEPDARRGLIKLRTLGFLNGWVLKPKAYDFISERSVKAKMNRASTIYRILAIIMVVLVTISLLGITATLILGLVILLLIRRGEEVFEELEEFSI